jgi:DNA gyrase/topoisomerase IV subunit B
MIGWFPLRGKLLNTMNASPKRLLENQEIYHMKQCLGLQEFVDYSSRETKLRYGQIMILTDPDDDGKHIAGLIMLFFYMRFRSLYARQCISMMKTPKYIMTKGKQKLVMHSELQYQRWQGIGNIRSR